MPAAVPTMSSSAPAMVQDQMSLTGGSAGAGNAAVMAAQADQLLASSNPQDRYAGLLAAARLAQVDPTAGMMRLQQVANVPGQDPQVVAFATRYLNALQASPIASGIHTLGQGSGVSQTQGFGSPQVMQPGTFAAQPTQVMQPGTFAAQPTQVMQPGTFAAQPTQVMQPGTFAAQPTQVMQPGTFAAQPTQVMQPGTFAAQPTQVMQPGTFAAQPTQVMQPGTFAAQPAQVMPGMGMRPEDSAIVLQVLRDDLNAGGQKGAMAIRQMAQIAQTNPESRENVFRLLVNHIYHKEDVSVGEAVNALVAMNDPRSAPYIAAVARKPGLLDATRDAALNAMKVMAQQQTVTSGVSGVVPNGRASIEYLRTMELELRKGGPDGIAAVAEMRQALAPNPAQPSAARSEVTRALLTYLRTGAECSTMNAAIQLLTEMRSREALPYLDWVSRQPGLLDQTREVAKTAVRTIAMGG
jgi:hypothetical protein